MIALEKTGNVPCFSIKQTSSLQGKASSKHRKFLYRMVMKSRENFPQLSGSRAVFLLLSLELNSYDFVSHS